MPLLVLGREAQQQQEEEREVRSNKSQKVRCPLPLTNAALTHFLQAHISLAQAAYSRSDIILLDERHAVHHWGCRSVCLGGVGGCERAALVVLELEGGGLLLGMRTQRTRLRFLCRRGCLMHWMNHVSYLYLVMAMWFQARRFYNPNIQEITIYI